MCHRPGNAWGFELLANPLSQSFISIATMITIQAEDPFSEDAGQLMEALSATLAALTGDSGKASFDPQDVTAANARFVIARDEQGIAVGCGAFRPLPDGVAEVKRMFSRQAVPGVGSAILAYLEAEAVKLGYRALWLETREVNARAVRFYEARGYARIPNFGKYAGNAAAVCFEKWLKPSAVGGPVDGSRHVPNADAIAIESLAALGPVISLLAECDLPTADLGASSAHRFFGIQAGGTLAAVVGLECYPPAGLLRSLAVAPAFRGQGLARALVEFAEAFAAVQGVEALFLLMTTADGFFSELGYSATERSAAPPAIQATAQFAGLCPCSAVVLYKALGHACVAPARNAETERSQGGMPETP